MDCTKWSYQGVEEREESRVIPRFLLEHKVEGAGGFSGAAISAWQKQTIPLIPLCFHYVYVKGSRKLSNIFPSLSLLFPPFHTGCGNSQKTQQRNKQTNKKPNSKPSSLLSLPQVELPTTQHQPQVRQSNSTRNYAARHWGKRLPLLQRSFHSAGKMFG